MQVPLEAKEQEQVASFCGSTQFCSEIKQNHCCGISTGRELLNPSPLNTSVPVFLFFVLLSNRARLQ